MFYLLQDLRQCSNPLVLKSLSWAPVYPYYFGIAYAEVIFLFPGYGPGDSLQAAQLGNTS